MFAAYYPALVAASMAAFAAVMVYVSIEDRLKN